jgi:hypothetical protein
VIRILLWRLTLEFLNFLKLLGVHGRDCFYFAYGANLNSEVMENRGMTVKASMVAKVPNFRLLFNHDVPFIGIGMASIESFPGSEVYGLVYTITKVDEWIMDCYEACLFFHRYRKATLTIENKKCFYYYTAIPNPNLLPSAAYLTKIINGYKKMFEGDSPFIARLENHASLPEMIPRKPPKFLITNYDRGGVFLRSPLEAYDSWCVKVFVYFLFKPSIFKKWRFF